MGWACAISSLNWLSRGAVAGRDARSGVQTAARKTPAGCGCIDCPVSACRGREHGQRRATVRRRALVHATVLGRVGLNGRGSPGPSASQRGFHSSTPAAADEIIGESSTPCQAPIVAEGRGQRKGRDETRDEAGRATLNGALASVVVSHPLSSCAPFLPTGNSKTGVGQRQFSTTLEYAPGCSRNCPTTPVLQFHSRRGNSLCGIPL